LQSDFVVNLLRGIKDVSGQQKPSKKSTTGSQFMTSLQLLMTSLNSTTPHYVRCIKPNDSKLPFVFENVRAVQQLRACGVLETIRISAAGFPSRWGYAEFLDRYRMLKKNLKVTDLQRTCTELITFLISDDPDGYRLGKTKIFFRAGKVAKLEKMRLEKLKACGLIVQKTVRAVGKVRVYVKIRKSAALLQRFGRGYVARVRAQKLREQRAAIVIQKNVKMFIQRRRFNNVKRVISGIQRHARGVLARRERERLRRERAAVKIQSIVRMFLEKQRYQATRKKIILAQSVVRRWLAKRRLRGLKLEARSLEHVKQLNKGLENKIISLQQRIDDMAKDNNQLNKIRTENDKFKHELENYKKMDKEFKIMKNNFEKIKLENEEISSLKKQLEEDRVDLVAGKVKLEEELRGVMGVVEGMKLKMEELERENNRIKAGLAGEAALKDKISLLQGELERERERWQQEVNRRMEVNVKGQQPGDEVNLAKVKDLERENSRLRSQLSAVSNVAVGTTPEDAVLQSQKAVSQSVLLHLRSLNETGVRLIAGHSDAGGRSARVRG
jgi:myosin-5